MADNIQWDVILRLATQGAKGSKQELEGVLKAAEGLSREGKVTERTLENTTRAFNRAGDGAKNAGQSLRQLTSEQTSLRYASYDVASSMLAVSAAVTGLGVASTVAFAQQERAFADVRRTAESELGGLEQSLKDLSTEIPVAFTDLAQIATLGNQLGVAAGDIESFTETVSAFSTVTGITADASAQAFGRIGNIVGVLPADFDNLASTITYVGRTSAATEKEIIGLTERLGASATRAGFTASEVVGLAGALGSLGVAPERAQGVLETYFNTLNESVAEGGRRLELFSSITGKTGDELSKLVRNGQGFEVFQDFIAGLQSADTVELTSALSELGLSGLRANEVIGRISQNLPLLQKSLQNSSQAWAENTELQTQMAIILDTLSAKWTTFINALTNAAAAAGGVVAPLFKDLLEVLTEVLSGFADFAQSDAGAFWLRQAATLATLVAGYAALRGVIALATGSFLALRTAATFMGGAGLRVAVLQLAVAMGFLSRNAQTGAISFGNLGKALKGAGLIGAVVLLTNLFTDLGGTVQWVGELVREFGNFNEDIQRNVFGRNNTNGLGLIKTGEDIIAFSKTLPRATSGVGDFKDASGQAALAAEELGSAAGDIDWDEVAGGAEDAAAKVRTLSDYASDLSGVWTRAFEIRFGPTSTMDAITTAFQEIRDAAEEARRNIRGLQAEIQGLESDINIQQRFLSVAIEYGDADRAQAIQANLAKLQDELAQKTEALNAEQAKNNKELTGNTAAAITNRQTISGLVQQYQAHIGALASSGLSTDELARQTEILRQDFINQATQLGFNRGQLAIYEQGFRDVTVAIGGVPRDITVAFNADPALQALKEFAARAQAEMSALGSNLGNALGNNIGTGIATGVSRGLGAAMGASAGLSIGAGGGGRGPVGRTMGPTLTPDFFTLFSQIFKRTILGFSGGGYTGQGGKYEPAGIVHRGEYVVPKQHVNQRTGLPYADAIGRLQKGTAGRSGYAGGGYVRGGGMGAQGPLRLDSWTIQQLAMVMDKNINVDGQRLASTVSTQYAHQTNTGAY